MFRHGDQDAFKKFRFAIAGLLLLSVLALGITVWFVIDFSHEQQIVQTLIQDLPSSDLADAQELAGELRWQSRLTFLIILQVVATALAVVVLWRAYQTSQGSLRDVKAFAADVLSSMDQAVITVDRDTIITSFNPRTTELLRVSHDPFGHPLRELTDQLDLEQFCRSSQAAGDAPHQRDFQIHANDRPLWLRAYGQPLRDAEGAIIGHVIQLRDVTSQQHVQEQLRRMERFMGLGALAAGLHHEIKNPLAAVSLHVQLLEEQLETDATAEDVPQLLKVIRSEIDRVGAVLEGFRDFASVAKLEWQTADIRDVVEKQIELIRPSATTQGIALRYEVAEEVPRRLELDRTRVEQVILNLILNAMEAMPAGGELTVRVSPREDELCEAVQISVADTGHGIPESILEHIFDAYFTTKSRGTGMGLALTDKIARQHGGRIEVSTSKSGSVFTLVLPVQHDVSLDGASLESVGDV